MNTTTAVFDALTIYYYIHTSYTYMHVDVTTAAWKIRVSESATSLLNLVVVFEPGGPGMFGGTCCA